MRQSKPGRKQTTTETRSIGEWRVVVTVGPGAGEWWWSWKATMPGEKPLTGKREVDDGKLPSPQAAEVEAWADAYDRLQPDEDE